MLPSGSAFRRVMLYGDTGNYTVTFGGLTGGMSLPGMRCTAVRSVLLGRSMSTRSNVVLTVRAPAMLCHRRTGGIINTYEEGF